jgi:hypothetical protein
MGESRTTTASTSTIRARGWTRTRRGLTVAPTSRVVTSAWGGYIFDHDPLDPGTGMQRYWRFGASRLCREGVTVRGPPRSWAESTFTITAHALTTTAPKPAKSYHIATSTLLETTYELGDRATLYGRAEQVQKSADDPWLQRRGPGAAVHDSRAHVRGNDGACDGGATCRLESAHAGTMDLVPADARADLSDPHAAAASRCFCAFVPPTRTQVRRCVAPNAVAGSR